MEWRAQWRKVLQSMALFPQHRPGAHHLHDRRGVHWHALAHTLTKNVDTLSLSLSLYLLSLYETHTKRHRCARKYKHTQEYRPTCYHTHTHSHVLIIHKNTQIHTYLDIMLTNAHSHIHMHAHTHTHTHTHVVKENQKFQERRRIICAYKFPLSVALIQHIARLMWSGSYLQWGE